MSPAGAGVAAYRAARDWSRAKAAARGISLGVLYLLMIPLALIAATIALGFAFGVVMCLYYGFTRAPLWTSIGLAVWLGFSYLAYRLDWDWG